MWIYKTQIQHNHLVCHDNKPAAACTEKAGPLSIVGISGETQQASKKTFVASNTPCRSWTPDCIAQHAGTFFPRCTLVPPHHNPHLAHYKLQQGVACPQVGLTLNLDTKHYPISSLPSVKAILLAGSSHVSDWLRPNYQVHMSQLLENFIRIDEHATTPLSR
jgi:hypothetical protein